MWLRQKDEEEQVEVYVLLAVLSVYLSSSFLQMIHRRFMICLPDERTCVARSQCFLSTNNKTEQIFICSIGERTRNGHHFSFVRPLVRSLFSLSLSLSTHHVVSDGSEKQSKRFSSTFNRSNLKVSSFSLFSLVPNFVGSNWIETSRWNSMSSIDWSKTYTASSRFPSISPIWTKTANSCPSIMIRLSNTFYVFIQVSWEYLFNEKVKKHSSSVRRGQSGVLLTFRWIVSIRDGLVEETKEDFRSTLIADSSVRRQKSPFAATEHWSSAWFPPSFIDHRCRNPSRQLSACQTPPLQRK